MCQNVRLNDNDIDSRCIRYDVFVRFRPAIFSSVCAARLLEYMDQRNQHVLLCVGAVLYVPKPVGYLYLMSISNNSK